MSYTYLAAPYYHPDPAVVEKRMEYLYRYVAFRLKMGGIIFCPVVHCHELAVRHNLPTEFSFWRNYNAAMLATAAKLQVLQLDGWDKSAGVGTEILLAQDLSIPLELVKPLEF